MSATDPLTATTTTAAASQYDLYQQSQQQTPYGYTSPPLVAPPSPGSGAYPSSAAPGRVDSLQAAMSQHHHYGYGAPSPSASSILSPVQSFATPALSSAGTMSSQLSSSSASSVAGGDDFYSHTLTTGTPMLASGGDDTMYLGGLDISYDNLPQLPYTGLGVSGLFHHPAAPSSGTGKQPLLAPQPMTPSSSRVFINPPQVPHAQAARSPSSASSRSQQREDRGGRECDSESSRGSAAAKGKRRQVDLGPSPPPVRSGRPPMLSRKGADIGIDLGDFDMLDTLGTGTFGRVILSRLRTSPTRPAQRYPHYFAMKVLEKVTVVRLRQVEHLNSERSTLAQVSHPFIVNMLCTFQDEQNLYILLEYVQGGELFSHLRRAGRFSPDVARFYAANLIQALEYLHSRDIIYRDLKPENLLIDSAGYLKITDFGFAKYVPDRTYTLCGTPEYLAPEIITATGHGSAADWWALGVLIFELLAGFPPFFADNPLEIYERILQNKFVFPAHIDFVAKDLIKRLLTADLSKRLGNLKGGARDVKNHRWFEGVDWDAVERKEIRAPIIPVSSSPADTSNFERYPHSPLETLPGVLRAHRARQYGVSPDQLEKTGPDVYGYLFPAFSQQMRFASATPRKSTAKPVLADTLLKDHFRRLALPGWSPSLLVAFRILILARFCGAMYTSIADCDEVYNYWEPLHYLWHGKGFQTWEYSPDYAIRSYFYLLIHSLPIWIARIFPNKRAAFFGLRLTLGTVSAFVEAVFYRSVADHISPHIARYLLWSFVFSAGFYSAASSFLPSTFAMWGVMLGSAIAMAPVDSGQRRIVRSGVAFAVAVIVGWPFAVLMAVPVVLEQLFVRGTHEKVAQGQAAALAAKRAQNLAVAVAAGASLLIPVVLVDSHAYQKWVVVPLNIVKYNIFPPAGAGPELYGVSPPSFYIHNGLLNFNILLPMALLSLPALALTTVIDPKRFGDMRDRIAGQTSPAVSLAIRLVPMHIFLAVLTLQSHKEERFLFPAYAHILLNATTTLYLTRCWLEQAYLKWTKAPYRLVNTTLFSNYTRVVVILTCLLSFARISALFKYYHAPMDLYATLQNYELPRLALKTYPALYPLSNKIDVEAPFAEFGHALDRSDLTLELDPLDALELRLCLGKEWHRFPSHFLVPDQVEVRFVRSAFDGILPKVWQEDENDDEAGLESRRQGRRRGLFGRATARVPSHMNAHNRAEPDRFVDLSTCHYLIDSDFPLRHAEAVDAGSELEPRYSLDNETWSRVECKPFLDAENSKWWSRIVDLPWPGWHKSNAFGEMCLLRSRKLLK